MRAIMTAAVLADVSCRMQTNRPRWSTPESLPSRQLLDLVRNACSPQWTTRPTAAVCLRPTRRSAPGRMERLVRGSSIAIAGVAFTALGVVVAILGLYRDYFDIRSPQIVAGSPDVDVVGFSGGCEPFRVYAQNRFEPYGARKLNAPDPLATQIGGFAPNQIVAADGWVRGAIAYPNNRPPLNSNVWFHVADGSGWVAFAAVRAVPTSPDPTGGFSEDIGEPAVVPEACAGAVQ